MQHLRGEQIAQAILNHDLAFHLNHMNTLKNWHIKVSIVYFDLQQLSKVSGSGLLCQGLNLGYLEHKTYALL